MTVAADLPIPPGAEPAKKSFLRAKTTFLSWALTTDHKRIGILFFFATTLMLALGGLFAMLIRIEHLTPGPTIMTAETYDRMFTLHGVIMVWLFMIPSIPTTFGNFILPLQIGATEVAFPKLNLASFYVYLLGASIVILSLFLGGIDTGWTFYVPYSAHTPARVLPTCLGIFIVGWSSIMTGVNFIATVHTMRVKGLRWMKIPLFTWAIYGTSIIQILATPVLAMVLIIVGIDHAFDWGMFDPARGGDPVLFQHLFWFYSHPAVYIMILPAMGVVSDVIPTFARKNPFSYRAIVYSTLGIAFVGFLAWGHHMFVAGISTFDAGAFGVLSMMVSIFSAIKVFTWVGTLKNGSISLKAPLLYVFSFFFLFTFGGMTGVALATMALDVHWTDTYFVVAHFHFIMVGGTFTGFLAALHYWLPKVTGRMYSERWALIAWALVTAGFAVTFTPQFFLGNGGMPRRYYDDPPQFQWLHVTSTVGSWALGAGMVMVLVYITYSFFRGAPAGPNPWGSRSFEWRTASPPPERNFQGPVDFAIDAYDYTTPQEPE
ncbi:MAG TPA: cbb3-type cytochrome c oxidase subunit I [Polyangiaceae bacterium]|jgi:cytochrome c oxidase subunit 1